MSLSFTTEVLTNGMIRLHLTWGDGAGLEGYVTREEVAEMAELCRLAMNGNSLVEVSWFTNGKAQVMVPGPGIDPARKRYDSEPRFRDLVDWLRGLVASGAFPAQAISDAARLVGLFPSFQYRERPTVTDTSPTSTVP